MTDRDALLAACLAAPDDDAPRLVYADWCDENGSPEWAELIRVGCEITRRWPNRGEMRCAECGESGHPAHLCFQWCESDLKRLAVRERALRAKVEWGLPVREWAFGCPGEVFPAPSAIVSRGMIEAVRVSGATWMELGDAILAGRPIRLVTLATWPDRSQILGGVLAGVRVYMMGDDNGMVTWHDRERQARRVLSDRWPSVADWEFPINPRDEGPPITHRQWMELERQLLT